MNLGGLSNKIGFLIDDAKKNVSKQINNIMVELYWQIGQMIVEEEQGGEIKAKYGTNLLGNLSKELTISYGKGFSRDNLENMRKLYLVFPKSETLSRKLSWSHYTTILRIDDDLKRSFYVKEVESENWSVRELKRQISSALFERLALSKDKDEVLSLSKNGQIVEEPKDIIKDPYVLEFLGLQERSEYNEKDLEKSLIDNIEKFILELGKGFMFVARQQRITLDNTHFYVDLVFYNRLLKAFVIIELKTTELKHEHLGQLQMYVNYYDRDVKSDDENKTIGILLCLDKKEQVVKYTLPEDNKQVFASKYKVVLPSEDDFKKYLLKERESIYERLEGKGD